MKNSDDKLVIVGATNSKALFIQMNADGSIYETSPLNKTEWDATKHGPIFTVVNNPLTYANYTLTPESPTLERIKICIATGAEENTKIEPQTAKLNITQL